MAKVKLHIATALLVVMSMVACGSQAQKVQGGEMQSKAVRGKAVVVPYKEAKNYFVKRGAVLPENGKISAKETFYELFGMATTMGEAGRPTEIDFSSQFVIALTMPPSRQEIEIDDERLLDDGETLTLEYSVERDDDVLSYEAQPLLIVIVDRQYDRRNIVLKEVRD